MDRSPFLKAIDAAGAATRDAGRRAQVAAPSAQDRVLADPDDLVARALGTLAETSQHSIPAETPSWHQPGASGFRKPMTMKPIRCSCNTPTHFRHRCSRAGRSRWPHSLKGRRAGDRWRIELTL